MKKFWFWQCFSNKYLRQLTLITLLRVPALCHFGSTSFVLPIRPKNRYSKQSYKSTDYDGQLPSQYRLKTISVAKKIKHCHNIWCTLHSAYYLQPRQQLSLLQSTLDTIEDLNFSFNIHQHNFVHLSKMTLNRRYIFETGAYGVPSKSQKSFICGGVRQTITLKSPGKVHLLQLGISAHCTSGL